MTEKSSPDVLFGDIDENYREITENIAAAAEKSGRKPKDITFMAVTKTVQPIYINHAIDLGVSLIGENKVQELLSKTEYLKTDKIDMHLIGHLQSNKVKKIIGTVSMIQSADSEGIITEISRQALILGKPMDVLLEVNIGSEESKTGFSYEAAAEAAHKASETEGINVRGFMAVPPVCDTESEIRGYFSRMNRLFCDTKSALGSKAAFDVLSLGMSSDYVPAILEGATLVRIGSALFGARRY